MTCEVESRQMLIARNLEAAFKGHPDQFHLAMQPIVDAASGTVLRWQSLLYWNHPQLGNIPPGEFIPIAESIGLTEAVGDLLLKATLQHLADRGVSLSVKVSRLTLTRNGFAGEIGAILDARNIDHSRLCLEIAEAVLADPAAAAALGELRRLGIPVTIDAGGRRTPADQAGTKA